MIASKFEEISFKISSVMQTILKSSFLLSSYFESESFLFKGHAIQVQIRLNRDICKSAYKDSGILEELTSPRDYNRARGRKSYINRYYILLVIHLILFSA